MIIFKGQLRILFHKHMNYKSLAAAILIMVTSLSSCGLPEDPAKWSDKQLEKWAQNSEWFNALPAKPASITDKREMATQIWLNPESWKVAFEFLSTHKLEDLEDGKIFLTQDQKTFANVQTYVPRESGKFERHCKYIDLQYVFEGAEDHQVSKLENLVDEVLPYSEERDVALCNSSKDFQTIRVDKTCFGLYFPADAHNPNLQIGGMEKVRKVVVKIPYVNR